ncbi:MAG TPA: ferrous iron transporter B [Verrucomicrobiae bacterium]|nr:ferrous iron transporter B [Verrucomicrobiae bacterium]
MNCHEPNAVTTGEPAAAAEQPILVLIGNPNVGKSVLFTKLTGKFVVISNYPGTTVEIARGGTFVGNKEFTVLDTPGINEFAPRTEDARVTCDVLRDHPEATIVQVADAKNLRRALLLTLQLAELGRPMVLALNLMDELDKCGGRIDVEKLGQILGIPVIPTVAVAGTGVDQLSGAIPHAAPPRPGLLPEDKSRAAGRGYDQTYSYLRRANEILAQVYTLTRPPHPSFGQRLGWWATHPIKGLAFVAVVLYFTFWFVGLLGAGTAVGFLEKVVFGRYINPWAIHVADVLLPFPHTQDTQVSHYSLEIPLSPTHGISVWDSTRTVVAPTYSLAPGAMPGRWTQARRLAHDFLVGEYGVITMALSYSLAIVLPIVTTFFLVFSLLEDSGYLSRLAVMVNRLFRGMGLNGKAVLPMVLGLGCDTMATMTTRILETRRERVITTLLLALAVPCSAQLGVLMAMMASISFGAVVFWVILMIVITCVIGWLTARLYGGDPSDFILELPPMRRPQMGNVVAKTFARLEWYLKEVIPLFVLGTMILFVLDKLHALDKIARLGEPLVTGWLGLPRETASAFLIGFLRRDYGAVFLLDAATGPHHTLSPHQVLVAMVTLTLFMPCIATLFMISRELGRKTAAWITVFIFPFAFFVGGLVNHLGSLIGF